MWRFGAVSFAFLGWSFYELSGGADYQPLDGSRQHIAALKREKAKAAQMRLAEMDAEQDARIASAVWPDANTSGAPELGFAVMTAGSQTDTVTRANVDLSSLPRITVTRSVTARDNTTPDKIERVTLTSAGATPAAQVAKVVNASLENTGATSLASTGPDIRQVNGRRVNMRMGPGTKYSVAGKLTGGTEVEVLQAPGNGWLKLRVVDSGRVGWMADYLVTAAN